MRFQKKPKIVEAIQVKDIISGSIWPQWLQQACRTGKVHVQKQAVTIVIGRSVKTSLAADWIAYDPGQDQVYSVSDKTLRADYDQLEDAE